MKNGLFKCPKCTIIYNHTNNQPLSLPCGHIYCSKCVSTLRQDNAVKCPVDNILHYVTPNQLPICQAIAANLPMLDTAILSCKRHANKLIKYYCDKHTEYLCTSCIIDHSGSGHHVVNFRPDFSTIKSKVSLINTKLAELSGSVEGSEDVIKTAYSKLLDNKNSQETYINKAYDYALKLLTEKKSQASDKNKQIYEEQRRVIIAQLAQITANTEKLGKIRDVSENILGGKIKSLFNAEIMRSLCLHTIQLQKDFPKWRTKCHNAYARYQFLKVLV